MGVFARIMMGLAEAAPDNKTISMDATYLKAHRTASSLGLKRGAWASDHCPTVAASSDEREDRPRAA
jgi:hypothetical protein